MLERSRNELFLALEAVAEPAFSLPVVNVPLAITLQKIKLISLDLINTLLLPVEPGRVWSLLMAASVFAELANEPVTLWNECQWFGSVLVPKFSKLLLGT